LKQVVIKQGTGTVEEVPAPQAESGCVLIQVDHSCISVGTEMTSVSNSGQPLWRRAMNQPQNVRRVAEMAREQGISRTKSVVQGKLAAGTATGYSCAGTVLEVGPGVGDIDPGDRIACAGASYAHHAEVVCVPRNLVVSIPEPVDFPGASTVTLGAIALQGVRRAEPTLGETFVVIGLGILGQLTSQLLKANGCQVIGTDLDRDRINLALACGMDAGLHPDDGHGVQQVSRLTDGIGADGVIITAASPSDAIVSTAFKMCRKKGRVVLVGDVGLHLNRADFYQKELDFFISSSYGPGRYDTRYEESGLDYPVGYVRWTENRNMAEYLRLLASGAVDVQRLISSVYPIDRAPDAYAALGVGANKPLLVLLSYPLPARGDVQPARLVRNLQAVPAGKGTIRVALVGAGGFAKGMHLPNLQKLSSLYTVRAIVSRQGQNAMSTARQYLAEYASTEYSQVLADPEVDAVILCTRHDRHARMVLAALEAGKHVLIEKPLALTRAELASIESFFAPQQGLRRVPVLLTGFNRRFSPYVQRIRELTHDRSNPMILNYRMNAGHIPLNHWVHGPEGGGRNLGEACHIYDLFTFLTGAEVTLLDAQGIHPTTGAYSPTDNFVATVSFKDGSVATLTYTAMGSTEYPKEQMHVYVDGKILFLDDYQSLTITGAFDKRQSGKTVDKGHVPELEEFARAIREGGEWPIPLWQQVQATEIALRVEERIRPSRMAGDVSVDFDPGIARARVLSRGER